jgi:hypothetical protein
VMNTIGWGALLLTMTILPRVWQDKAATPQTIRRRERWRPRIGKWPAAAVIGPLAVASPVRPARRNSGWG